MVKKSKEKKFPKISTYVSRHKFKNEPTIMLYKIEKHRYEWIFCLRDREFNLNQPILFKKKDTEELFRIVFKNLKKLTLTDFLNIPLIDCPDGDFYHSEELSIKPIKGIREKV